MGKPKDNPAKPRKRAAGSKPATRQRTRAGAGELEPILQFRRTATMPTDGSKMYYGVCPATGAGVSVDELVSMVWLFVRHIDVARLPAMLAVFAKHASEDRPDNPIELDCGDDLADAVREAAWDQLRLIPPVTLRELLPVLIRIASQDSPGLIRDASVGTGKRA